MTPLVVIAGLAVSGQAAASAPGVPTLDAALLREAPKVLGVLKGRGCHNVGVLKFRVKKGNEPVSDRVGTLNVDLASRLEVALVLATDLKAPIGIIRDASAVAARTPGASHLTEPGRRALFGARYPLAWGKEGVEPDAFLTGVARLGPDLKTVTVTLLAFGRDGGPLENLGEFTATTDAPTLAAAGEKKLGEFTATTDAPTLAAAGESFRTRGGFDAHKIEVVRDRVADEASKVKTAQQVGPLQDPTAPVGLEVFYDDRPEPLEARDGKTFVREPAEGQSVRFVLRKRDRTPDRYGVVLLVNGLNTLGKERLSPLECRKWVLGPDAPTIAVKGFQTGAATVEAFRVLSAVESEKNAMDYGTDAGTLTLVVFRERTGPPPPPPLTDEGEDLAAVSRGALPADPPANLAALKFRLREGVSGGPSRGMIVEGEAIHAATRAVTFAADPTPVMAATVVYYRPGPGAR